VSAPSAEHPAWTVLPPEYRARTTPSLLAQRADEVPDATAFRARFHGGAELRRVSRQQWDRDSGELAAALHDRFGIGAGAPVAWVIDNRCAGDALLLYLAVHRLGAVNVPVNARSARPELEHVLVHSGAELCVFGEAVADQALPAVGSTLGVDRAVVVGEAAGLITLDDLSRAGRDAPSEPVARVGEEDVATILYTSGTTGRPKGVVLTHGNVVAAGIAWADAFRLGPDDVFHTPFPIFSGAGLHYTAMAALFSGATCIIDDADVERMLERLESERTTVFAAVPSIYQFWLESPKVASTDTSSVRTLAYGGASMPPAIIRRLREAFPSAGLMQTYGLTEAGPGGTYLPEEYALRFLGSIGTRAAGRFTRVRVIDEHGHDVGPGVPGELVLQGSSIMRGYFKDTTATHQAMPDGWLRTGDVVRVDEYGALYHLDRQKDIIVRGGFNVSSVEVESVLLEHPAVVDAAAVGMPHEKLGETVAAFVVLRLGEGVGGEELTDHCRARLADFKVPSRILMRDALPRNAAGKVRKQELRDELVVGARPLEARDA
jgi:acyl-CoA synthetase (AMP-forming)/AMP-acid ligase II